VAGIKRFSGHKTLRELVLTGVPELAGDEIQAFGDLPALERLCFAFNGQIKTGDEEKLFAAFASNKELRDLRISGLSPNEKCVQALANMKAIKSAYLEATGPQVSYEAISGLTPLKSLKLSIDRNTTAERFALLNHLETLRNLEVVTSRNHDDEPLRKAWKLNPHYLRFLENLDEAWLENN
jgi:hypothetical protein